MRGWRARAVMMLPLGLTIAACGGPSRSVSSPSSSPSAGKPVSVITAPASDCAKFAAGSLPRLTRLAATSVSGLITKVDPATFDYWVRVSPSASGLTRLTVTETTSGASVTLNPNGGVVLAQSGGSAAACAPVTSSVTYGSGPTTVTFDVAPATTYYVEVVYSALALVGQRPGSAAIIASVTTTGVAGSGAEVSVVGG